MTRSRALRGRDQRQRRGRDRHDREQSRAAPSRAHDAADDEQQRQSKPIPRAHANHVAGESTDKGIKRAFAAVSAWISYACGDSAATSGAGSGTTCRA